MDVLGDIVLRLIIAIPSVDLVVIMIYFNCFINYYYWPKEGRLSVFDYSVSDFLDGVVICCSFYC